MLKSPRIGPDMHWTHWLLYFKPTRLWFQKKKLGKIGEGSEIRPFVTIYGTQNVQIGTNVIVRPGTILCAGMQKDAPNIIIEDNALLASNVSIYAISHHYEDISRPVSQQGHYCRETVIRSGAWIGTNSVILPGVTVGRNAVVGANSVVTKDVPDYTVVGGVPAKHLKNLAEPNANENHA